MNLQLKVDGKEYRVGCSVLDYGIGSIPDVDEYSSLYYQLAKSPSSNIRKEIAEKECIDDETLSILINDTQLCVLKEIIGNNNVSERISEAELIRVIELNDSELCCSIAENIESFCRCDPSLIAEKLYSNKDPVVRVALAENSSTPKHVVRKLLKDSDPDVVDKASYDVRPLWKLKRSRRSI
ncbi:MAG: hypothetical protein V3U84_07620 [Thiotrichaceae bacterium]